MLGLVVSYLAVADVFTIVIGPVHPIMKRVWQSCPTPPTIVTDEQCLNVSRQFNEGESAYKSMSHIVIRSDVCRFMMLCIHGGTYVDSDIGYRGNFSAFINRFDLAVRTHPP